MPWESATSGSIKEVELPQIEGQTSFRAARLPGRQGLLHVLQPCGLERIVNVGAGPETEVDRRPHGVWTVGDVKASPVDRKAIGLIVGVEEVHGGARLRPRKVIVHRVIGIDECVKLELVVPFYLGRSGSGRRSSRRGWSRRWGGRRSRRGSGRRSGRKCSGVRGRLRCRSRRRGLSQGDVREEERSRSQQHRTVMFPHTEIPFRRRWCPAAGAALGP